MSDRLVWIDCEMTGLDLGADALIEVAALVTDFELNVLGEGIDIIIKPPAEALEQMIPFVREMHEKSGLLGRARPRRDPGRGRGAGAGLHQGALPRRQPTAAGRQHRRHRPGVPGARHGGPRVVPALPHRRRLLDQGALPPLVPPRLLRRPDKRGNHRALADIQESIEELRYYREAVFVAPPGPDSATAKEIAARHGGSITGSTADAPDAGSDPTI